MNIRKFKIEIGLLFISIIFFIPVEIKAQCRELAWSDEFDEAGLPNPSKWSYDVGGGGWGNNELQYYTSERSKNARVENGSLIIEAHKETFMTNNYTSAKLNSKFSLKYGRVEMKAILPHGRGTWAAMWMLANNWNYGNGGWPDNGEIDIMEYVGHDPDVTHASVHSHNYNWANNNVKTNWKKLSGLETGYHIYAMEWDEHKMDFYVDDIKYLAVTDDGSGWEQWPFDKEFRLILNLAIGGSWGGEKGVDNTIFPAKYVIDYVRMYSDPADFLPVSGPIKVFKDSTYIYSVPNNIDDTYSWTIPATATALSRTDSHAVKIKWSSTGGTLAVDIAKICDVFKRSLDVHVYDPLVQLPYNENDSPWPIPGKIEVEDFDKGGNGVGYYDKSIGNSGPSNLRSGEDVDIETCDDTGGGTDVGWIEADEWLEYTVDVEADEFYNFNFRIATPNSGGRLHVEMNGMNVTGSVIIPNSGGWQNWVTKTVNYKSLVKGKQLMRIVIESGSFNFNTIEVTQGTLAGIADGVNKNAMISLVPNPTQTYVNFSLNLSSISDMLVTMSNGMGQVVYEKNFSSPSAEFNTSIDVSQLVPGAYMLRCVQDGKVYYSKLIKK